jgi:cold shock CspA family protein/ribosome-associated translation inhibitor RaiA
MQLPLQVSFRHVEPSPAIEAIIPDKAAKLDNFAEHIMSCRVVIEPTSKHHRNGNLYNVRIDITLPRGEVVATRQPDEHIEYKEIAVAIRDAFDAVRRQLEDYVRRQRGAVKTHAGSPHARVSGLFPEEDHGFLTTPEGREIYFHRSSILHEDFDQLTVGAEVSFVETEGEQGPQASTVRLVGRHGHI